MDWLLILSILKIIGLVLLGIIALIIFLLLLVLFVPITYRIYVSYENEFTYFIKVYFIKVLPGRPKEKNKKSNKKEEPKEEKPREKVGIKTIFNELTNENNKYTLSQALKAIVAIIKYIGPRKVIADCDYGFTDPSITGYSTGLISLCPFVYNDKVRITPDFNSEVNFFKGFCDLRGHLQIIFILIQGLKLLADKRVRKTIKHFSK